MKYLVRALRHPHDYEWWELRPFQRHSLVLAVAGLVYIGVGIAYTCTDPTPDRLSSIGWALEHIPLSAWGVVWILVGILAVLSARWPPASKTWGYSALTGLSMCWSALYGVGIALFDAPPEAGITGCFVWGLVSFLWWAIAGLTNPDDLLDMVDNHAAWASDREDH